jgi:hypothetical protein
MGKLVERQPSVLPTTEDEVLAFIDTHCGHDAQDEEYWAAYEALSALLSRRADAAVQAALAPVPEPEAA